MNALLGDKLRKQDGSEVDTSDALAGKKAIGLYFSAHWCPPCRGFTPKLAEIYKKLIAAGKELEIVFVSSDRDEDAFKEYAEEQPWLALPYGERKMKDKLSKKFKVQGIPTLVFVNDKGETITKDGRSAIMEDQEGNDFPWTPPTIWEALGDEVLNGDGDDVAVSDLRGEGKVIGVYFSAHWCPPCKGFTPELVKTYQKLKEAGKQFEIIFVSSDKSMSEFQSYFKEMPWLAIPPEDKRKKKLDSIFEVQGIPTFVVLDGVTGETINADARGAVGGDPDGKEFPWHPKPVNDMEDGPGGLNENTCLCVMLEGCSEEVQTRVIAELNEVAEKSKAAGGEFCFYYAKTSGGQVSSQIRKLSKIGEPTDSPQMVLFDIPDNGGYYNSTAEVNATSMEELLAGHTAGSLDRQQLG